MPDFTESEKSSDDNECLGRTGNIYHQFYNSLFYLFNSIPFVVHRLNNEQNFIYFLQKWFDYKLQWDPDEYGGIEMLYVPSENIWLPDIVMYNK